MWIGKGANWPAVFKMLDFSVCCGISWKQKKNKEEAEKKILAVGSAWFVGGYCLFVRFSFVLSISAVDTVVFEVEKYREHKSP